MNNVIVKCVEIEFDVVFVLGVKKWFVYMFEMV